MVGVDKCNLRDVIWARENPFKFIHAVLLRWEKIIFLKNQVLLGSSLEN